MELNDAAVAHRADRLLAGAGKNPQERARLREIEVLEGIDAFGLSLDREERDEVSLVFEYEDVSTDQPKPDVVNRTHAGRKGIGNLFEKANQVNRGPSGDGFRARVPFRREGSGESAQN